MNVIKIIAGIILALLERCSGRWVREERRLASLGK